jgi:hypothetical protein
MDYRSWGLASEVSESNGELTITGDGTNNVKLRSLGNWTGQDMSIHSRMYKLYGSALSQDLYVWIVRNDTNVRELYWVENYYNDAFRLAEENDYGIDILSIASDWYGSYAKYNVSIWGTSAKATRDNEAGTVESTGTHTLAVNVNTYDYGLDIYCQKSGVCKWDYIFVRKYHDPEPTYSIGGNPPSVTITSPTNTTYVFSWGENNSLTFNFSVSGESSTYHVKTYLDGTLKYENTSFENNDYYSINYTVSTGSHNFSVWVNDTTNNLQSTKEVFFSVLNLNDWSYRKAINISVSSGTTPANYQVPMNITYDLDMLGNFSDLRFVNGSDNYELGYWIENYVDSSYANVWVKIDQNITTSNYTIYMYYGNPSATSASSGNATFVLFDDFESGTLDNWNVNLGPVVQSTTVYEGNYAVKFYANNGDEIYRDLSDGNYSLTFYANLTSGDFYGGFNVYPDDYVFALRDGFTYFRIRQQSVTYIAIITTILYTF